MTLRHASPTTATMNEPHKLPAKLRKTIQPLPSWEVVLLVDTREPVDFFNQLSSQAGVTCERRRLATFDFLWVARRCTAGTAATAAATTGNKDVLDEFVLGHACERKEIKDLANSLNSKSKSTGLIRNVYQKLKMSNSGVENKFYIVQGEIKDLYKTHMQWDVTMAKRVHENIKTMEEDGYTVSSFAQDATTQIVDFLRGIHHNMESLVANQQPPDSYMPLTAMIERADWVTELGSARGVLGEKMLKLILSAFPISFATVPLWFRDSRLSKLIRIGVCPRVQLRHCVPICLGWLLRRIRSRLERILRPCLH
jgi:ERCC4-type nuclease